MKSSPVQLLQSTIEKISVDANLEFDSKITPFGEDVELQVREICEPFPDFWNAQERTPPIEELPARTYLVRLAIRSNPEKSKEIPYSFELIFSGVVASVPSFVDMPAADSARQYGLAMLYGAMREQFLTMTSRMPHGARLLPTASFMDGTSPGEVQDAGSSVLPAIEAGK